MGTLRESNPILYPVVYTYRSESHSALTVNETSLMIVTECALPGYTFVFACFWKKQRPRKRFVSDPPGELGDVNYE